MTTAAGSARSEVPEVAFSHAIFAAMQVCIPWLAALTTPLGDLAALSLAQSVVWPIAMMAQLQLRNIYLVQGERRLLPLFVQLRLAGCVLLVASAAIAMGVLRPSPLLFSLALALALIKCVEHVADIMHAELQRAMEIRRASRSQTYRCAIFIGVYTAALLISGQLLASLLIALAAMGAWVLLVDMQPSRFQRDLLTHRGHMEHMGPTLKAGLCLSTAVALSSLSVMVGRWAAMRAGDMEAVAAAALAGTMASVVAVVLGATQQYSFTQARAQLAAGGIPAFRAWCSNVTSRLHLAFALLTLAWIGAVAIVYEFTLPLPGSHARGIQDMVAVLAGFFLAGGWLSVLCFRDTLLLALLRRNAVILLIAMVQVTAAVCGSLLLYPLLGWVAIGVAELLRGLSFFLAVRYAGQRFGVASQVT